ncbi:MAG: VPLPA-CTERM sorting domain-containing protein [Desulfobacter sp.]|nr:MAG: VPLPA-CTERM sorting domain-containing protein [Desulfobacter sp.]
MVWGYRWDGEASGEDMLMAIVNNDSNLYAKVSGPTQYGIAVFGLGYDVDSDGFGISDGSLFTNGITQAGYSTADGSSATDPDDLYTEGWYQNGYWSYWLADGTDWGYSGTGMSGRTLSDGDVDGWGFSFYGGGGGAPSITPAPVPVPAAFWLLGSGIIGLAGLKRRN